MTGSFEQKSVVITSEERALSVEGQSVYLPWQDKNGDKLPDACDVNVVPAQNVCKDCVPNPLAISKDWRKSDQSGPFLNEKICQYQITYKTSETTTGYIEGMTEQEAETELKRMYANYSQEAAVALLKGFQKDTSVATVDKLLQAIEYTAFDLDTAQHSRLKLLYSVDFTKFSQLPAETNDDDDLDEAEDVKVSFETSAMAVNGIRARKTLNLYGRFAKVARAVEGKNIRFQDSNKIFNLEDYGDAALFTKRSPVGDILMELEKFLNGRGYQIPGINGSGAFQGLGKDRVIKLDFVFTPEYKLKKIKVYTEACGTGRPDVVYGSSKLEFLNATQAWKDPTAVAYFSKLEDIEKDSALKQPMPFEEFVVKHTYPPVFVEDPGPQDDETVAGCIADALRGDMKELGQDIFDEVFSLADAIAYKFHKNLCESDPTKIDEEALLKGFNMNASFGPGTTGTTNVYSLAKIQAFDTITVEDSAFAQMCFRMISMGASGVGCGISPIQQLDQMWSQGFDRIAICGLMDLLLEAIQCLFKGLTLEEALASIIRAALNSMGVSQIGELFVGLPPEKQLELEKIVNQKLKSGDIFPEGSPGQAASDIAARNQNAPDPAVLEKFKDSKPWDNPEFVEAQEKNKRPDNYGNMVPSKSPNASAGSAPERRTVGQKLQEPMGENFKAENFIVDAYIQALLELYKDSYLDLLELLNKFPGAQLIATIIAFLDCPTPPLFNPGFDDFFKSLQLPFCRNINPVTFPRWENPFLYIPKLSDILKAIFEALKRLVFCLIMRIIVLIMAKICEIIADAICKLLETAGQIGAGLLTGNANVREIIKSTICGPNADDETVDNTILELMENFGVGGAAFADPEKTVSFFGDFINSSTREEALNMFIEGPSPAQLDIAEGLLDNEYEEFRGALPNKNAVTRMVKNISNVIPATVYNEMREAQSLGSDDLTLPMNPSLCATPEARANFEQERCDVMAGRMSPDQCRATNRQARDQTLENLGDLNQILNDGIGQTMENAMPPIFSDPACDNGLLPFEPEESIKTATGALKGDLQSLQIAYTDDMLGNGGLFGSNDDWGFMNMVLSDTLGNPYTAHQRKTFNNRRFVDFNISTTSLKNSEYDEDTNFPKEKRQRGAYPVYVAEWLKYQISPSSTYATDLNPEFVQKNDIEEKNVIRRSFDDMGFGGVFDTDVNVTEIQDFGYNTKIDINFENNVVKITEKARKKSPDITLKFRDNSKGYRTTAENYAYGFNMKCYYSDIHEIDNENAEGYFNINSDNIRIKINERINTSAKSYASVEDKINDDASDEDGSDSTIQVSTRYEFFAVDDTLDKLEINERDYPSLLNAFTGSVGAYSPPVAALADLMGSTPAGVLGLYNSINNKMFEEIRKAVKDNSSVWRYGAEFDGLTERDIKYGIVVTDKYAFYQDDVDIDGNPPTVGKFVEYEKFKVPDRDEDGALTADTRNLRNEDAMLGISYDAFVNKDAPEDIRVHYLDPTQFGQSYLSPSFHIKAVKNEGWLGAINLMFPEYTPCKPRSSNLIAFDDIQDHIDNIYGRIPEDERLKTDPDCVFEAPFNRILSRPSRAGLESVIMALIRIFASTHFIKSLPVFGTFAPKFPENYSNIYAAYVIESMEEACLNAGNNFLSPFKDNEFWYAFLEQAVQVYSRRLDDDLDETITPENVPNAVKDAIERINKLQDRFDQPSRKQFRQAPSEEKSNFQTLKGYREEKVLEAVREEEEAAKLILLELVKEQMSVVSDMFSANLKESGISTGDDGAINMDYWFLEEFADGAGSLNLKNVVEFVETTSETFVGELAPTELNPDARYTHGAEMALPDGTPYFGHFHSHEDENGNRIFMVGEVHTEEDHSVLIPFAKNVTIQAKNHKGKLKDFDISESAPTATKDFYIQKYVRVGGSEKSVSTAQGEIRALSPGANISDFYPGSIRLERDDSGKVIGVDGELNVKHGLVFGIWNGATKVPITRIEIGALDTKVKEFSSAAKNSKMLLCLLNNLRDDPKFRMTIDYIFSVNKALSIMAIYTDLGFLPSIGEYVQDKGAVKNKVDDSKPGVGIALADDGARSDIETIGWANEKDRNGLLASPFFRKWDEWDQVLLRKSVRRTKKIFRPYYRKRKFEVEDADGMGPGERFLEMAKARFKPNPGGHIVPWFKKRKLKPNPFNSKGQLCKKRN